MPARACHLLRASTSAALIAVGACVAPPAQPPLPAARPAPAPALPRAPVATPPAAPSDWMDAPQTAGDWTYRATAEGTGAFFGAPSGESLFALQCQNAGRTITLVRSGLAAGSAPMTIRTESTERLLNAQPQPAGVAATLAASDPTLDAMAYSKGRFAVEVAGMSALYLPAWPEVARVLEDCR